MKIEDLPEEDVCSLYDEEKNVYVECRIMERIVYGGEEFAICQQLSGEKNFYVVDARTFLGQAVSVNDIILDAVREKFLKKLGSQVYSIKQLDETEEAFFATITDEDGMDIQLEVLDRIDEGNRCYVVFMDAEDEETDEVIILELEETEGEDLERLKSIEDDALLEHLFEVFKERNIEIFQFTDD